MAVVRIFEVMPDELKGMEAVIDDIQRNSSYLVIWVVTSCCLVGSTIISEGHAVSQTTTCVQSVTEFAVVIIIIQLFKLKFVCVNCGTMINIIEQFSKWFSLHITTSHKFIPEDVSNER
jgi:hypothetical protein